MWCKYPVVPNRIERTLSPISGFISSLPVVRCHSDGSSSVLRCGSFSLLPTSSKSPCCHRNSTPLHNLPIALAWLILASVISFGSALASRPGLTLQSPSRLSDGKVSSHRKSADRNVRISWRGWSPTQKLRPIGNDKSPSGKPVLLAINRPPTCDHSIP